MKREGKKPRRSTSSSDSAEKPPEEPQVEVSGGASIDAAKVEISGDVVGRDKLVAGGDIVQGDQYRAEAGGIVVGAGGQLRQTIVNLPRSARLAVIAGAAALIVIALGVILPVGEAVADGGFESGQSGNRSGKWELSAGVRIVESNEEDTPDNGKWKASVPVGEAITQPEVEIPPAPSEMSVWYRSQNGSSRGTLQVRFDNGIVYSQGVAAELEWEQTKFPINHEKYGGRTVSLAVEYLASAGRAGGLLLIAAQPDVNAIWVDNIQISEIDAETVAQVTVAPTATASATPTRTPAPTFTPTPTPAPTETPLPAAILTDTPSLTHTSTRARTRTPTATWTLSPTPTPTAAIDFSADRTAITAGECVTLRWAVENVREVYLYGGEFGSLPGVGVAGRDSRRTCPPVTAAYTLRIIKRDGSEVNRMVTISVTAAPTSTAAPTPAPPPPVVNGSFEQPPVQSGSTTWFSSIPGWSLSFGPAIEVNNNVPAYGLTAADGAQLVELDSYAPSGIFQDLPTAPGASYTLIFTFGARPGYGPDDNALEAWWDGSPLATLTLDGTGASTAVWQDYSYIVTATGSTTRLEFRDVGTPSTQGTLLDNVRMASAP